MPIPPALLAVHWILLEHCVEHVRTVNLTGQVAIVPGIVAADQVPEGSLTMTPAVAFAKGFRAVELADLVAQSIVDDGPGQLLASIMRRGFVDGHVEDAEMELAQIEQGII